MKNLEIVNNPLTLEEIKQFNFHCDEITNAINDRNRATGKIIQHVDSILKNQLWRGYYESPDSFIKDILNIEKPSYDRFAKANRMYLYLAEATTDEEEQASLSMMREGAYRELRRISTDGVKLLKYGDESTEEYQNRVNEKELKDFESVKDLWSKIYPHIRFHKEQENKILPNGACKISDSDITIASKVLYNTIEAIQDVENEKSIVDIEGVDYSLKEVVEKSEGYAPEVIDAMTRLGISEGLTEKLKRQKQHLREKLEESYVWDKYEGLVAFENGKLVIKSTYVTYDLLHELHDLIGETTSISVRRTNKKI